MTLEEFREIDRRGRADDPVLFSLSTPDRCATSIDICTVEQALKIALPQCYRSFLMEFGGGSYGLTTIFSAAQDSEWYLPKRQSEASDYLPRDLLAFSDDFAGGLYVLRAANGMAEERVLYWNCDGGLVPTTFGDVFEFVARYAYEPA